MINRTQLSLEYMEYIEKEINEFKPWYHKIDLGGGIVTPRRNYDKMWSSTRQVFDTIDYSNKNVLDLVSWDGMWAFEAEKRGAAQVVATDARFIGYPNMLFAREVLQSNIIPLCNVPIQNLEN